jgi:hypothetical protein
MVAVPRQVPGQLSNYLIFHESEAAKTRLEGENFRIVRWPGHLVRWPGHFVRWPGHFSRFLRVLSGGPDILSGDPDIGEP